MGERRSTIARVGMWLVLLGLPGALTTSGVLFIGTSHASAGTLAGTTGAAIVDRLIEEIIRDTYETRHYTGRDALSQPVLDTMRSVPRDAFVPADSTVYAWENRPLTIGYGQTISQPFIVALMTDLLETQSSHRILEIGTGSGYQAAVLSSLVAEVYTIEIIPELAHSAEERLDALEYHNVSVRSGDGWHGWPEVAPFDGIIVTAVSPDIPPKLLDQLKTGARMVIPIGPRYGGQNLTVIVKTEEGYDTSEVLPVQFVPLTRLPE